MVLGPQAPLWLALTLAEAEPDAEPEAEAEAEAEDEALVEAEADGVEELEKEGGGGDVFMNPIHCGSQLTSAPGPT